MEWQGGWGELSDILHLKLVEIQLQTLTLPPQAKVETRALKAKRPGFTDERYNETSYFMENGTCLQYDER